VFDLFRRDLSTGTTVRIAEGSPSSAPMSSGAT
jgi:hypothetical protein